MSMQTTLFVIIAWRVLGGGSCSRTNFQYLSESTSPTQAPNFRFFWVDWANKKIFAIQQPSANHFQPPKKLEIIKKILREFKNKSDQ